MPKLEAPENGVAVRMYRQGHGDCFLLALPNKDGGDPIYVLIDCGVKPGSQDFIHKKPIGDIVKDIAEATGSHLHLVVITHEHQDHLNGIWKKRRPYFGGFTIDEAWMAWTENPDDPLANELRQQHHDQLLSIVNARQKLAFSMGEDNLTVRRIDSLLNLEFGGEDGPLAVSNPESSVNKQALKLIRDKANEAGHRGVRYLDPGGKPLEIAGSGVRAFVLGPPRDAALLGDEDPKDSEAFPDDSADRFTFAAAASPVDTDESPFSERFVVHSDEAFPNNSDPFYVTHYGKDDQGTDDREIMEVPDNAPWRRIDDEWLFSAEALALKLNTGVNNTSLVLAFELPASRKVLLFVGDAQRGNWISWSKVRCRDGETTVTARDLLARTVLYKVGHHGSHNATLAGTERDSYANLSWMAKGASAGEFTAMIPAVSEWARTKNRPPWVHPLPSIRKALMHKAQGRVLQTDDAAFPEKPKTVDANTWQAFRDRCTCEELYFDYIIPDS